jgi:ribosome maturation factor RimP
LPPPARSDKRTVVGEMRAEARFFIRMKVSEETVRQVESIAREKGCRLLALEGAGAGRFSVLRVVLERANGDPVTVEDCESVSREVSELLDRSEEIPHRYTLEVSSAGLDRKLYSLDDARRFVGRRVQVKTEALVEPEYLDANGRGALSPARNFSGRLESVDGDRLRVVDEVGRRIYNVRFGDIRSARLDFEWPKAGRAGERAVPR